MTDSKLSKLEQSIVDNIASHGCFVMSVFDPEQAEPDFSYSIGFSQTVDHPEVITFSLPSNLRASMINEIYRQIAEDGLCLEDGLRLSDLIEGFDCVAREVCDPVAIKEHFGSAIWYERKFGNGIMERAFQIVWPGAQQGLFPWEVGCSAAVIADQPPLYDSAYKAGTVH